MINRYRFHIMIGVPLAALIACLLPAVLNHDPGIRRFFFAAGLLAAAAVLIAYIMFGATEHARHDRELEELRTDYGERIDANTRLLIRHLAVCAGRQAEEEMDVDDVIKQFQRYERDLKKGA